MKITKRQGLAAFTLIELMAVITIIVILAGLIVGGLGFVNERQAREKAKVQIGLLSKGLESYKLDMGTYPATANSADGKTQSARGLYIPLFYEGYQYGSTTGNVDNWTGATTIYIADLDPTSSKQGWVDAVKTVPATTTVKDPWGNEYRYRTAKNSSGSANASTINPDFDLWSSGKDAASTPDNSSAKESKDDIKNF